VYSLAENHDFSTILLNKILDEFKSKLCKAGIKGNHKFELIEVKQSSQYGFKPFTLKVEVTNNVFDDLVGWISALHELDLSLDVISLFGTTDATVANPNSVLIFSKKRFNMVFYLPRWGNNVFDFGL